MQVAYPQNSWVFLELKKIMEVVTWTDSNFWLTCVVYKFFSAGAMVTRSLIVKEKQVTNKKNKKKPKKRKKQKTLPKQNAVAKLEILDFTII